MQTNHDNLILNVDDNDGARYVKNRILTLAGFTVIECENGEDALRLAREKHPALILLDVKLPDINGMEVCRILKSDPATKNILILQTSASFLGTADKIRALDGGADNYLMEPIDPDELVANVKALLRLGHVERQLREVDRRKDEFIATLAHELRNPIGPIRNAIEIWKKIEPTTHPALSNVRDIVSRQADNLAHLVDDLLDASRISNGKINLRLELVTLKDFLNNAVETATPMIETRQHSLTVNFLEQDIWVYGDPLRLSQVVTNLLLNAAKFTPPSGAITINCAVEGESLLINIADNGIGISSDEMSRIFDIFSQSRRSPAQYVEGLGIGLALVKSLLELHGGEVKASSEGINCGSTFEIRLPIAAAPACERASNATSSANLSTKHILVVDDNEDAVFTLTTLLELSGNTVTTAYSGKQAIEETLKVKPQIIFLDIGLPDITGYDLAREFKSNNNYGKPLLIALTGFGQDHDRQAALDAGFDHHFVKPVNFSELRDLGILS